MDEKALDWNDLQIFLAVARSGGLAPAVTISGKSAPTLGRRMLALERHLGQSLFIRSATGYQLTDDGLVLLDKVIAMEAAISQAGGLEQFVPRIRISAGTWMSWFLCTRLNDLTGNDGIPLQFIAANHRLDIEHREVVIGIRNARPQEHYLAYRRTGRVRFAVFASSENASDWISVLADTPSAHWVKKQCAARSRVEVNSPRNALDCILNSNFKAVLPVIVGQQFDQLNQLSASIDELEHEQWLVVHHNDRHLPEVRIVLDRLYDLLKDHLAVEEKTS